MRTLFLKPLAVTKRPGPQTIRSTSAVPKQTLFFEARNRPIRRQGWHLPPSPCSLTRSKGRRTQTTTPLTRPARDPREPHPATRALLFTIKLIKGRVGQSAGRERGARRVLKTQPVTRPAPDPRAGHERVGPFAIIITVVMTITIIVTIINTMITIIITSMITLTTTISIERTPIITKTHA